MQSIPSGSENNKHKPEDPSIIQKIGEYFRGPLRASEAEEMSEVDKLHTIQKQQIGVASIFGSIEKFKFLLEHHTDGSFNVVVSDEEEEMVTIHWVHQ